MSDNLWCGVCYRYVDVADLCSGYYDNPKRLGGCPLPLENQFRAKAGKLAADWQRKRRKEK